MVLGLVLVTRTGARFFYKTGLGKQNAALAACCDRASLVAKVRLTTIGGRSNKHLTGRGLGYVSKYLGVV